MKKIFILIGSLVLVLIVVKLFKGSEDVKPNSYSILSAAEDFVKAKLKSSSTSEFSSLDETSIIETDPNVYEVRGFVDAQNSFGAQLKNNYYVRLHFSPYNKTYSATDIKLE